MEAEQRADWGLPFLLKYENIAWFEDGIVRILDRRVYPQRVEFVSCRTHTEVAQAITDMGYNNPKVKKMADVEKELDKFL